jgi:hypothetical protein
MMTRSARRNADNVETVPMGESGIGTNTASESRDDAIARRAFELYSARGYRDGHDIDDWLNAERELRAETSSTAA